MMIQIRRASLVLVGVLAGVLLSLNFSAVAQREAARFPLPVDELRAFAEVFGAIKSSYVEPVEDKKLITEAISGMLTGLDPHSAYLDQDAFRELQVGTQGQFGGLGIEVGYGWVRVSQFQEHTGENLVKHVEGLYKNGPLKGLILDLRNDPGGLLNGAVGISSAFLQRGVVVVSTDGRTEDAKRKFIAAPED